MEHAVFIFMVKKYEKVGGRKNSPPPLPLLYPLTSEA
jgi:hypothetical protein